MRAIDRRAQRASPVLLHQMPRVSTPRREAFRHPDRTHRTEPLGQVGCVQASPAGRRKQRLQHEPRNMDNTRRGLRLDSRRRHRIRPRRRHRMHRSGPLPHQRNTHRRRPSIPRGVHGALHRSLTLRRWPPHSRHPRRDARQPPQPRRSLRRDVQHRAIRHRHRQRLPKRPTRTPLAVTVLAVSARVPHRQAESPPGSAERHFGHHASPCERPRGEIPRVVHGKNHSNSPRGWAAGGGGDRGWFQRRPGCGSRSRVALGRRRCACWRAFAAWVWVSRLWCQWHSVRTSSTVVRSPRAHCVMCAACRFVVAGQRVPSTRRAVHWWPSRLRHASRTRVGTWVGRLLSQGMRGYSSASMLTASQHMAAEIGERHSAPQ